MTDVVRWLDDAERAAWLPLLRVVELLPQALDRQLREQAGVNHVHYSVLAVLSAEPEQRLPLTEVARRTAMSQSRASHAVTSLEQRGWVTRRPCPDDGRVQHVVLTDLGRDVLRDTAPGHVAEVRRLVFDALDPDDVEHVRRLALQLLSALDPSRS